MIFLTYLSIAAYEVKKYLKHRDSGPEKDPFVVWGESTPVQDDLPLLDDLLPPMPDPGRVHRSHASHTIPEAGRNLTYAYCPPIGSYRTYYTPRDAEKFKAKYGTDYPVGKPFVQPEW